MSARQRFVEATRAPDLPPEAEGLAWDGETLAFSIGGQEYSLVPSETYPTGDSTVYGPDDCLDLPGPLDAIIRRLVDLSSGEGESKGMEVEEAGFSRQSSQDSAYSRQDSFESQASSFVSDEESDDVHPLLELDAEWCQSQWGAESASVKFALDKAIVELSIDITFLSPTVAGAWKVARQLPLIVQLFMNKEHYVDGSVPPRVKVFQVASEVLPLGVQLGKIVENFLQAKWGATRWQAEETGEGLALMPDVARLAKMGFDVLAIEAALLRADGDVNQALDQLTRENAGVVPRPEAGTAGAEEITDADVATLASLGFAHDLCVGALQSAGGSVEAAAELLMDGFELPSAGAGAGASAELAPPPSKRARGGAAAPKSKSKSKSGRGSKKGSKGRPDPPPPAAEGASANRLAIDGKAKKGPDAKALALLRSRSASGFLGQLYVYVRQRIPTLNNYCVICDTVPLWSGAMLKPAVCSKELCAWSFTQLGVMSDAADEIGTDAEVVDLLVSMTRLAAASSKAQQVLMPYPHVFEGRTAVLNPSSKDFSLVSRILEAFPSVQQMVNASSPEALADRINAIHPYSYGLLQWIIASNRAHIVALKATEQISEMRTDRQFLMLSAPPEKEERFQALKRAHGSTWVCHGSAAANWHSITRNGLCNYSGTSRQANGAAHGSGIYLAADCQLSFSYSAQGEHTDVTMLALCEVAQKPDIHKSGVIWVAPDPDCVVTRFLFVYKGPQSFSVPTTTAAFAASVQACLDRFGYS